MSTCSRFFKAILVAQSRLIEKTGMNCSLWCFQLERGKHQSRPQLSVMTANHAVLFR